MSRTHHRRRPRRVSAQQVAVLSRAGVARRTRYTWPAETAPRATLEPFWLKRCPDDPEYWEFSSLCRQRIERLFAAHGVGAWNARSAVTGLVNDREVWVNGPRCPALRALRDKVSKILGKPVCH